MEVIAAKICTYDVSLKWDYETDTGIVRSGNRMPLLFGPLPESDGSVTTWSPEHLLCASVASCYTTMFLHFAMQLKVKLTGFRISAKAEFKKRDFSFEATRFILRPVIELHANPGQHVLENLLEKARMHCFISNSLKGEIVVDPNILNS